MQECQNAVSDRPLDSTRNTAPEFIVTMAPSSETVSIESSSQDHAIAPVFMTDVLAISASATAPIRPAIRAPTAAPASVAASPARHNRRHEKGSNLGTRTCTHKPIWSKFAGNVRYSTLRGLKSDFA